jgi:hypothetical protein
MDKHVSRVPVNSCGFFALTKKILDPVRTKRGKW